MDVCVVQSGKDDPSTEIDDIAETTLNRHMTDSGAGAAPEPERELMDSIVDSQVQEALVELPEHFRSVVLLDAEGFHYKEIAEMLGIPMGTVMSRLHRGRKFLKERLMGLAQERGIA